MAERVFFDSGLTFVQPVELSSDGRTALLVVDRQYHDAAAGKGFCAALAAIEPGSCAYFDERVESSTVPTIARPHDAALKAVHFNLGRVVRSDDHVLSAVDAERAV